MSEYDWAQVFQTLLFDTPLNLIKCVHHAHFQANQHRHLKIYIGGPLMPAHNRVKSFTIVIINGTVCWGNNWYMRSINSTKTLRKIPSFFKPSDYIHCLRSCWNFDILLWQHMHYRLAYLADNDEWSWNANSKQMRNGPVSCPPCSHKKLAIVSSILPSSSSFSSCRHACVCAISTTQSQNKWTWSRAPS